MRGRGDLEGVDGLRTDSPTAEIEAHHPLFSYAAPRKLQLKMGDIPNAYFQGEALDRVLLLKPPESGIPDPDYADKGAMILARAPIYGTQDAGRKFWRKLRRVILGAGWRENKIARALWLYILEDGGGIQGIAFTHAGDLCWVVKPGYEGPIQKVLDAFVIKKVE